MTGSAELLESLKTRYPKVIDLSLGRVETLLARLGDPHAGLPPVIHVAGTNGKGSTVAYLRAMMEAAGLAVHVFTSPHLVSFNERIVLGAKGGGAPISEAKLAAALAACDEALGDGEITFFEATTCAALLAFAEAPADAVLLEVGLGGRLDATNVIAQPAVSVITPIGFDHQDYLGDTLAAIAGEKAGIIKRGAPVVSARQEEEARSVIARAAARAGGVARFGGEHWQAYSEHGRMIYSDEDGLLDLAPPRLAGAHQIDNAGLAIAALRTAKVFDVSADAMAEGVLAARWPGRLQRLRRGPLVEACAGDLWLDGGHNAHAAQVLARAMADMAERGPWPLVLICAMQRKKDAYGFFSAFAGLAREAVCVPAPTEAGYAPFDLAAEAKAAGVPARIAASVEEAIASLNGEPVRVLICGSLYLAGEILKENG